MEDPTKNVSEDPTDLGLETPDITNKATEAETTNLEQSPASPEEAPRPKASRFGKKQILIVGLAVLLAGFLGWWFVLKGDDTKTVDTATNQSQQTPKLGVATGVIEGKVEYSTDGSNWSLLTADTDLAEGNTVKVADGGRAVLLVDDGSAVRLAGGSSVRLTSLSADNLKFENLGGEVYTRVVASSTRKFSVSVGTDSYEAKGTAYRTFNKDTKKGVEVYHSAVAAKDKEVTEGNALLTLSEQKEKENIVTAIDLEALKQDAFLKWNCDEDKKTAEFADKLGVLGEFDKPAPVAPKPAPAPSTGGITLSGSVSEYSAKFSWKVSGVDTSKGYKLVKSKTSKTPTYPENSAAYIEAGKTSYSLFLGDGKTYYFRLCAYRGDSCVSYSNTVTITTPVKEVEPVVAGPVTLSLTGSVASWTFGGTAPHGFKIVASTSNNAPTYPDNYKYFTDNTSKDLDGLMDSGTWYVRVCKYTGDGCTDYSNAVTYVKP